MQKEIAPEGSREAWLGTRERDMAPGDRHQRKAGNLTHGMEGEAGGGGGGGGKCRST